MLNAYRFALALAAALGILCLGTAAAQAVATEDIEPGEVYYARHNGTWFDAASPFGPWVMADDVPPTLYTIPPGCPVAQDGILCVYNDATDYVADFSGWPWVWSFGWNFHWLPSAIVIDRAVPGATRTDTFEAKSPRGEPHSEPRSQPRSSARSAPRDERPYSSGL